MTGRFAAAAARQQRHQRTPCSEGIFAEELFTRNTGSHRSVERMPDKCRLYVMFAEETLLEREDAEQLIDESFEQPQAPLAPGPRLRSNVVEDGNTLAVQLAR